MTKLATGEKVPVESSMQRYFEKVMTLKKVRERLTKIQIEYQNQNDNYCKKCIKISPEVSNSLESTDSWIQQRSSRYMKDRL